MTIRNSSWGIIDLTDDPPRTNIPTWKIIDQNCPDGCVPNLPTTVFPEEIEDFRKYEQDPENNNPPRRISNCQR